MTSSLPRIPEILKIICDYLVDEKATLASLARTCKDFEEPALNVLWYEIEGFYPLAACLPSHMVEVVRVDGEKTLVLSQPLTSLNSCERFFYYSKRVRSYMNFTENCTTCVEKLVYEALHLVTQGNLLPNVQELAWYCNDDYFPYIYMFMGPNLARIDLTVSPHSLANLSFLSVLYERHPFLTDVVLEFVEDEGSIDQRKNAVQLISGIVYRWQNLEVLEVPNLTYSTLCELSKLQQLKRLLLSRCQLDTATPRPNPKGGFPALSELLLEGCSNASDCIAVLRLLRNSPVSLMKATFRGTETSATLNTVFEMIATHCSRLTFQQLEIEDGMDRSNVLSTSLRREMIKYETLKPLLIFHGMRWVSIGLTRGILISEPGMVKEMLTSWPKVEELLVKSRPFARCEKPLITLQDVIRIASSSRRLEILGLAFDATSPPEVEADNANFINVAARKLKELYVGDSPIKDPSLVAASLSGVFPSLKNIKTIEDEEDLLQTRNRENGTTHKVWKKADQLLKVMSAIRSQERLYAKLHKNEEEQEEDDDTSDEE